LGEGFCGRSAACVSRPRSDEAEQAEIARLKREVTKLKAERDILKKAAAYFAKEST
jgi:transposase-like protein